MLFRVFAAFRHVLQIPADGRSLIRLYGCIESAEDRAFFARFHPIIGSRETHCGKPLEGTDGLSGPFVPEEKHPPLPVGRYCTFHPGSPLREKLWNAGNRISGMLQ